MPAGNYGTPDYRDPVARLARDRARRGKKPSAALARAGQRQTVAAKGNKKVAAGNAAAGMLSPRNLPRFEARKQQVDEDVAMLLRQLRKQL